MKIQLTFTNVNSGKEFKKNNRIRVRMPNGLVNK